MSPDFPAHPLTDEAEHRIDVIASCRYRLQRDEDPVEGVRRVARGRSADALEQLRDGRDLATAVHQARKDLKKLRALVRLVRPSLGAERYRIENDRCRAAGRRLSGARDAEVALATLDDLRGRYRDAPATDALRKALATERRRHGGRTLRRGMDDAAELVERVEAGIDTWDLRTAGFELVGDGATRAYRRGRHLFAAVRDDPSDEAVHAWRKRVKDLWYHLRLLRDTDKPALKPMVARADELAELLGDHHDLAVLVDLARTLTPDDPDTPALRALAARRQAELLDAALACAPAVYRRKPKAFRKRLEAAWNQWRDASADTIARVA